MTTHALAGLLMMAAVAAGCAELDSAAGTEPLPVELASAGGADAEPAEQPNPKPPSAPPLHDFVPIDVDGERFDWCLDYGHSASCFADAAMTEPILWCDLAQSICWPMNAAAMPDVTWGTTPGGSWNAGIRDPATPSGYYSDGGNNNDGLFDQFDNDRDNDGLFDQFDYDSDNDGLFDQFDYDSDNDGLFDQFDNDGDNDGLFDQFDNDRDNDGLFDRFDYDDGWSY